MLKTLLAAALLAVTTAGPRIDIPAPATKAAPATAPSQPSAPDAPAKASREVLKASLLKIAQQVGEAKHKHIVLETLVYTDDGRLAIAIFNEGDIKVAMILADKNGDWAVAPDMLSGPATP